MSIRRCDRRFVLVILLIALVVKVAVPAAALSRQDTTSFDADLRRAEDLAEINKTEEALPLLERLYALNPEHPQVVALLASTLVTSVGAHSDSEKRKSVLVRARQLAEKALKLGRNTPQMQFLVEAIPPNGEFREDVPQANAEAQQVLREAEFEFAKGNMEAAISLYDRALALDATYYEAPLFAGDAYSKMGNLDKAGESYARAIAIDPDRDTAYRYWGDVLMRAGRLREAKEKLVEAVIVEPYSQNTWEFLGVWGQVARVPMGHPRIEVPRSRNTLSSPGNRKDGTDAWNEYHAARASWSAEDSSVFKDAYPGELQYRHSLQEEVSSLEVVVARVEAGLKAGDLNERDLDISIANLVRLRRANLIEPFILFAMPDESILKDYPGYREKNRDKLRQYLNEVVTGGR